MGGSLLSHKCLKIHPLYVDMASGGDRNHGTSGNLCGEKLQHAESISDSFAAEDQQIKVVDSDNQLVASAIWFQSNCMRGHKYLKQWI